MISVETARYAQVWRQMLQEKSDAVIPAGVTVNKADVLLNEMIKASNKSLLLYVHNAFKTEIFSDFSERSVIKKSLRDALERGVSLQVLLAATKNNLYPWQPFERFASIATIRQESQTAFGSCANRDFAVADEAFIYNTENDNTQQARVIARAYDPKTTGCLRQIFHQLWQNRRERC